MKNSKKYMKDKVEMLRRSNPTTFFRRLKVLGARPGEDENKTFSLASHANLSAEESAELIAAKFSEVSQEISPLDLSSLPARVKNKLENIDTQNIPNVSPLEVFQKFQKRKLKNSTIPGDIPPRIKKEFGPWIAGPAAHVFNAITHTGMYPRQWVDEYVTPVPKNPTPESEDELRPISIIADLARDYQAFIADWLTTYVIQRMDPGQMGG